MSRGEGKRKYENKIRRTSVVGHQSGPSITSEYVFFMLLMSLHKIQRRISESEKSCLVKFVS